MAKNQKQTGDLASMSLRVDEKKLTRIFKKYNCSFGNKFTSSTSLKGVAPLMNEAEAQEKVVSSRNMQQLVVQENK